MRLTTILILLISSIGKLFLLESVNFSLVESGLFNWETAIFVSYTVLVIEFSIAFSLLFNTINRKINFVLILLLCGVYIADLLTKFDTGTYNNTFGLALFNLWIVVLAVLFLLFFAISNLKSKRNLLFTKGKRVLINLCIVLIISGPMLAINPIYIDDFQYNDTEVKNANLHWDKIYDYCSEKNILIEKNEEIFFAFYSTSCYYCNLSSIKLGITGRKRHANSKIILVFPGNKEDTDAFIKRNRCDFPFIRISKDEFRSLAGNEYPAFFKVKNKKETNYYSGRTFNYPALDNLFN